MDNVYQARTYASGDEKSIVELLRLVFPDWLHRESPIAFWKWKYLSPPLGSIVAVVTQGGKIIGTSHNLVVRIKNGDEVYTGTYGDDAATHPDHQGKGVYLLGKQVVDRECIRLGAVMDYSIPIHPAFARSRDPGQVFLPQIITHVIKVRDPETYLKAKGVSYPRIKGWAFRALGSLPGLRSGKSVGVKSGSNLMVEVADKFDDRVNQLWKTVCASLNFALVRDDAYLNWRYCDARGGNFIVLQASENGVLMGYVVAELRISGDEAEGFLMDLFTVPERPDVKYELTKNIIESLEAHDVNSIHFKAAVGHPNLDILKRMGFVSIPDQQRMVVKVSMKALPLQLFDKVKESTGERIHFGYGDYI